MKFLKNKAENLFYLVIITKWLHWLIEIIWWLVLFFVKSWDIKNFVYRIFQHELLEDPWDIIANFTVWFFHNISVNSLEFSAIYLISYWLVNFGLFLGLRYKKYWSYIVAWIVIFLLIIYQFIRIFSTHSIVLLLLTLIDIFILVFLKSEYKKIKNL